MRLNRKQLLEEYRKDPNSPLRQHIDAIEEELRILSEVNETRAGLIDNMQLMIERLKQQAQKNPDPVIVVADKTSSSPTRTLRAAAPLTLTEDEILQYAVEVEMFDK